MQNYTFKQKLAAEFIGTAFLLATIIGSGIMAERLAQGNMAIALLGNTIPTGAILIILINMLAPISGAHFNPVVTFIFTLKRQLTIPQGAAYIICQITAAILGVWAAHLMFNEPLIQASQKIRTGNGQWFSEAIATFGLVITILLTLKANKNMIATAVGLYITAAYWFTSSTSFANPAVTIARSMSNSFAGIRPIDVAAFITVQFIGGYLAYLYCQWQLKPNTKAKAKPN
ncbi:MAG: aquaporin family protein [Alphaproteobacteria bacterium]|nr:aquaporin family protein [Alphaproteobacteria bacterium]